MIKKNVLKLGIITFFLVFCGEILKASHEQINMPEEDRIVHEIIDSTIESIRKKYNLHPCGIGLEGKFEYLEISFETSELLEKDKARMILIDCTNEFLEKINTHKIEKFLKPYPFVYKNVGIVLYILDENRKEPLHPKISLASTYKGKILYRTVNPENTFRFKETYEESYEEALALLKKNKDSAKVAENKNHE
ncbi:MAG: hypothetical protein K1000chlam3_01558 [Chlamydiae bacterium]|nr:hypothetical protein [Chlamydiota bacterium]